MIIPEIEAVKYYNPEYEPPFYCCLCENVVDDGEEYCRRCIDDIINVSEVEQRRADGCCDIIPYLGLDGGCDLCMLDELCGYTQKGGTHYV